MTPVELAATSAALLLVGVAGFQIALGLGAPLGEATMGGRAPTVDGVLLPRYRFMAVASAVILLIGAWIVLARAGMVDELGQRSLVGWAAWVLVAFSVVNTLTNLSGRHPLERWGLSAVTMIVAILVAYVALSAP